MARYTVAPFAPPNPTVKLPSKTKRLEEKALSAVRRIKRIRVIPSPSSPQTANVAKKTTLQNPTLSTTKPKPPLNLKTLVHRCRKSSASTNLIKNNTAAHKVLFVPELLEVILTYVPSLQVLTSIRQVHPFFKDLVHTSPVLAWQTWTSKSPVPPRRILNTASTSTTGLGLYTISNSVEKPPTSPRNPIPRPGGSNPSDLEICALLHPILSKWWKTIARNTTNYRFFQVDSCVYNRFFPPDLLSTINFTRPAIHIDDLILSFTSTYAFLSYGCTHNITLEDQSQNRDRDHPSSPSSPDLDDDDIPPSCAQNCSNAELILQHQRDMSVTIEKLLRMMWIPLSETLRRSRDEKFLKLSGLKYTRTMTVTVKARDGVKGEERGVMELNLECMEPYDVSIERLF
ncbi:uncharacterized protein DFL_000076 [Arthrobotrys flagrans]|uniref:F-box domain-containing protein n=1 Tax=Arthrobotrys flagrans TaxID=97331 RepID=A0A437ACR1_ARTFL|nr:hypothetical protein DFL_000076 [Arthrobotrys flagrans]